MLRLGIQLCRSAVAHRLAETPGVCSSVVSTSQLLSGLGRLPQRRCLSESSKPPGDGGAGADQLAAMLDVMMQDPGMQDMLMARMPPHMRKPEVLRAMMANPDVKMRIVGLMQTAGMDKVVGGLSADRLKAGMEATRRLGVDPAALYAKLSSNPQLAIKVANPRMFAALMDICQHPDHVKNYKDDKEVLDVYMEAGDLLQNMQSATQAAGLGQADTSATSSSGSSSSAADQRPEGQQQQDGPGTSGRSHGSDGSPASAEGMEKHLGMKPEELMKRLMARPDLMAKVTDPKVQKALIEVAGQPWKAVKYLFNKDVMSVLMSMKDLLKKSP